MQLFWPSLFGGIVAGDQASKALVPNKWCFFDPGTAAGLLVAGRFLWARLVPALPAAPLPGPAPMLAVVADREPGGRAVVPVRRSGIFVTRLSRRGDVIRSDG